MTTFWLSFNDPDAPSTERFVGVVILDMDESEGRVSNITIIRRTWALGINPGGMVSIQEVEASIPEQYKNRLITDDALLLFLGSKGRVGTS